MIQVAIIALTAAILVGGNTPGTLKPENMGSTAQCLYQAEINAAFNQMIGWPGSVVEAVYQSDRNECMWAKAQSKKD
jgi:hypothetical protein